MGFLDSIFGSRKKTSPVCVIPAVGVKSLNRGNPLDLPPGYYAVADADELMAANAALIEEIRLGIKAPPEEYPRLYLPMIKKFANYVGLLPASKMHHHKGPGGLFRHSLEVAYQSLRLSNRKIFSLNELPRTRRLMISRWEYAAFMTGLCHDGGKLFSDMEVTSPDGKSMWDPFNSSLYNWARNLGIDHYRMDWRPERFKRHESSNSPLFTRLAEGAPHDYLYKGIGATILETIFLSIQALDKKFPDGFPVGADQTAFLDILKTADEMSVVADKQAEAVRTGTGGGVFYTFLDVLNRLLDSGDIVAPNTPGGPLWVFDGSLYLVWPRTAKVMAEALRKEGITGLPRDPKIIAGVFRDANAAVPHPDDMRILYWDILPLGLILKGMKEPLKALRLGSHDLLFPVLPPNADGVVLTPDEAAGLAMSGEWPERVLDLLPKPSVAPASTSVSQIATAAANPIATPAPARQPQPASRSPVVSVTQPEEATPAPVQPMVDVGSNFTDFFGDSDAGEMLKVLAMDLAEGDAKQWGVQAKIGVNGFVHIEYPSGFDGMGFDAANIVKAFSAVKKWLAQECSGMSVFHTTGEGRKYLILGSAASAAFLPLAGKAPSQHSAAQAKPSIEIQKTVAAEVPKSEVVSTPVSPIYEESPKPVKRRGRPKKKVQTEENTSSGEVECDAVFVQNDGDDTVTVTSGGGVWRKFVIEKYLEAAGEEEPLRKMGFVKERSLGIKLFVSFYRKELFAWLDANSIANSSKEKLRSHRTIELEIIRQGGGV